VVGIQSSSALEGDWGHANGSACEGAEWGRNDSDASLTGAKPMRAQLVCWALAADAMHSRVATMVIARAAQRERAIVRARGEKAACVRMHQVICVQRTTTEFHLTL
jgi:hypothetical protein